MTAEEAIKELREASDSEVRYGDTKHHYDEVIKRVAAYDMAIKALEQTRWIPVSERLPEEKGNYLVCYNDGYISVSEWHPNPYEKVCFDLFPSLIVAWMPIMPYKAESEDKE